MPRFVNLTPHPINVLDISGNTILTVKSSGVIARVSTSEKIVGSINNIPLVQTEYGDVIGLPRSPEPDTYYIVSILVAQAVKANPELYAKFKGRLLAPNTSPTKLGVIRDNNGRIVGVRSFIVL